MRRSDEESVTDPVVQNPSPGPHAHATDCLVLIHATDSTLLGKRFVLETGPFHIGRGGDNQIDLGGDSVSRHHALLEPRSGRWWCVDDGSTNGTVVNDKRIEAVQLASGDLIKVGSYILKFLSGEDVEAQYYSEIYRMTVVDALTQAHVRSFMLESLEKEIARARRYQRPLSLVLFDIDHFKQVNDLHGHQAGDFVLKEVAHVVKSRLRSEALLARYGGEEFVVVLPETGLECARNLAEVLRATAPI